MRTIVGRRETVGLRTVNMPFKLQRFAERVVKESGLQFYGSRSTPGLESAMYPHMVTPSLYPASASLPE